MHLYRRLLTSPHFQHWALASCPRRHSTATAPSYYHRVGTKPLVHRTVGQQLERAARLYGDREAIVSCAQSQRLTYAAVLDQADRLAAGYRRLGLQRGDRIGIWSPNTVEWYVTMMAAARAGLVSVALNPAYLTPEIAYCLHKVGMRAIFAADTHKGQSFYQRLCEAVPELPAAGGAERRVRSAPFPDLTTVVVDSVERRPGAHTYQDVLHMADADEVRAIAALQPDIGADEPCNIQFTSGTTGSPKAALLSHHNLVNNGRHIGDRLLLGERPHRVCVPVPLFHVYGVVAAVMAPLAHGATVVLPAAGYSPTASLRAIAGERCTVVYGTPTMHVDLVAKQRELRLDVSSAELALTGGAPCSPQLFAQIGDVLGLQRGVRTLFGLTETTCSAFFSVEGEAAGLTGKTVGMLQEHLEAKVVDEGGRTVAMGEPGELLVRGYAMMLGYYGDAEKTAEAIGADGWLRTGDQFVLQPDGYGRIVGRLKDVIIRGGENVYPKEVEDLIGSMPQVLECHVYGVPDERLGEEVAIDVRMTAADAGGQPLTGDQVRAFCGDQLAGYKVPRFVRMVDSFPKTASGKIQKFKLRERFLANREE